MRRRRSWRRLVCGGGDMLGVAVQTRRVVLHRRLLARLAVLWPPTRVCNACLLVSLHLCHVISHQYDGCQGEDQCSTTYEICIPTTGSGLIIAQKLTIFSCSVCQSDYVSGEKAVL